MTFTVNVSRIFAVVRQMAALAAPVIAGVNVGTLTGKFRAGLAIFGGLLLAAEHIGEKIKPSKSTTKTTG